MKQGFMVLLMSAVVLIAACDPQSIKELEEGVSTETDVRARFGDPEQVWDSQTPGVRVFEYNRQPEGHKNYQISIGPDGKMIALRQVLTQANFAKIAEGMMLENVRRSLGKPASIKKFELSKELQYSWRFMESGSHESKIFAVVFDRDLKVMRTEVGPDMQSNQNR